LVQAQRNSWLIVLLLGLASLANIGIAKYRNPEGQPPPRLDALPDTIGAWRSAGDLDMPRYVLAILRPDAWISRGYRGPSGRVAYVFAQFHSTNRWGAHQPEVCFTSQGWVIEYQKLTSTVERRLPGTRVSVNRFLAHKGESTQLVLYWWFSSGKFQTASRTAQMLDALRTQILTGRGGGNGFIEVSTSVTPGSEAQDEEALERFAAELVPRFAALVDAPRVARAKAP
jgi:EpsI family protein